MGYTTVVDAAIAPTKAALAHLELTQLPVLDSAILALAGNEAPILEAVRDSSAELVRSRLASTLAATHAWGIKVVDPGGIARWKAGHPHPTELDDPVDGCPGLTPRRLVHSLADAVTSLGLPHAVHLHGFKLGLPGSAETLLDLFQSLEGRRVHFAHIQFHSYGGGSGSLEGFASRVAELADLVNRHDQITLDVGQVMFGPTMVMTADSGVGEYLADLTGRPWNSVDIACESGCAVLPVNYMPRNVAHALQWSIGLEWYLRVADPWRMALTTDHPNGGFFQVYPELIALLMSRELRREAVSLLPESVQKSTSLSELDREYSLAEIAILTRAAPARILGMSDRGHLGPGAIADIVVYRDNSERARMFGIPVRVWKSGLEIHGEGERDVPLAGETLAVRCAAASAETDSHMYRDVRYEDSDRSRCLRRLREVEAVPR
jgi:formylmethanofuran dehydrogenase subunit A